MEGITCDFQARRGRRDFSGHSELRLLRSHSLAGHTSQPNLKLLVLVKPELPRHTDSRTHVPRAAPRGIVKPESQGSGRAWFRIGCLTGFSDFTPE